MKSRLFKEIRLKISCLWGQFLIAMSQVGQAFGAVTLAMAGIAAYPTIRLWLLDFGIELSFWLFVLVIGIMMVAFPVVAWRKGTAGYFNQWNAQWWNNNNPMRDELREMRQELNDIKTLLDKRTEKRN